MAQIDREGLERLQHIRNAIDVLYDELEKKNVFNDVVEYFEYIVEILEEAKRDWKRVG